MGGSAGLGRLGDLGTSVLACFNGEVGNGFAGGGGTGAGLCGGTFVLDAVLMEDPVEEGERGGGVGVAPSAVAILAFRREKSEVDIIPESPVICRDMLLTETSPVVWRDILLADRGAGGLGGIFDD